MNREGIGGSRKGLEEEEEEMKEGEQQAVKGVDILQTQSFILHVLEWVSQLLKVF